MKEQKMKFCLRVIFVIGLSAVVFSVAHKRAAIAQGPMKRRFGTRYLRAHRPLRKTISPRPQRPGLTMTH